MRREVADLIAAARACSRPVVRTKKQPTGQCAEVSCGFCRKPFRVRKCDLARGLGKYCSVACSNRGRTPVRAKNPARLYGSDNPNWRGGYRAVEHVKNFKRKYPEKAEAHRILKNAVSRGDIACPGQCSRCGAGGRIEGHHADYSRPLDVQWLCHRCHIQADNERRCA